MFDIHKISKYLSLNLILDFQREHKFSNEYELS